MAGAAVSPLRKTSGELDRERITAHIAELVGESVDAVAVSTAHGHTTGVETGTERGWNVYSFFVDIPSGDTVRIEANLAGQVDDPLRVVTWVQPMTNPLEAIS